MKNTSLPHGARYERAWNIINQSEKPLTKSEIESRARISPFNSDRWLRFQTTYQDRLVVHPITGLVHRL